jgi:hypothetical protein
VVLPGYHGVTGTADDLVQRLKDQSITSISCQEPFRPKKVDARLTHQTLTVFLRAAAGRLRFVGGS